MVRVLTTMLVAMALVLSITVFAADDPAPKIDPGELFKRLDANADSTLSKEEFKKLATLGQGKFKDRPEVFDQLFERLDADRSGALSAEEFKGLSKLRGQGSPPSSPTPTPAPPKTESGKPAAVTAQGAFTPIDVRVGDPKVSYAGIEFTIGHKYMVWTEGFANNTQNMVQWHCEVNPDTGDLIPPDGKGFRAFDTTGLSRANPGRDSQGIYYVGMNRQGRLVLVRPTSATTGTVTILPTAADLTRRGIYCSDAPEQPGQDEYVIWIKNENVVGGPGAPRNAWVELRYISLTNPAVEHVLQHQDRPPAPSPRWAPLDAVFPRWIRGRATLTSGIPHDANGVVQVVEIDFTQGAPPTLRTVTDDAQMKGDAFGWEFGNQDILMSGAAGGTGSIRIYTRPVGQQFFKPVEIITPSPSTLTPPLFGQSAEHLSFGGRAYVSFQVNPGPSVSSRAKPGASGFFDMAFSQTGEIWLSTVLQTPQQKWRLSDDSDRAKFEPENYVGRSKAWVFYNSIPKGSDMRSTVVQLRRCETPLRAPESKGHE